MNWREVWKHTYHLPFIVKNDAPVMWLSHNDSCEFPCVLSSLRRLNLKYVSFSRDWWREFLRLLWLSKRYIVLKSVTFSRNAFALRNNSKHTCDDRMQFAVSFGTVPCAGRRDQRLVSDVLPWNCGKMDSECYPATFPWNSRLIARIFKRAESTDLWSETFYRRQ